MGRGRYSKKIDGKIILGIIFFLLLHKIVIFQIKIIITSIAYHFSFMMYSSSHTVFFFFNLYCYSKLLHIQNSSSLLYFKLIKKYAI